MSSSSVDYQVSQNIARLTINRAASYNALDLETAEALCDAAMCCSSDPTVRAVMLTGAGNKAFCAGGDVASFARNAATVDQLLLKITEPLHKAVSLLARMNAPVIAVVNGVAAGAGLSLVACSDYALASDNAIFTSAYSLLGFAPDGGNTYYLPRLIGERRAMEMYLTNRSLTAHEAQEWGLINRVVSQDNLTEEADRLAHQFATGPTQAFGAIKKLMITSRIETLENQMQHEATLISTLSKTPDGLEGVKAFTQKRKAAFVG